MDLHLPKLHLLTEYVLINHALLLCYVENRVYNCSSIYNYDIEEDEIHPSYMVVMTTFVGLALALRLSRDNRIKQKVIRILICLYYSKLAMLCMSSKSVLWESSVLLSTTSLQILLYKNNLRATSKLKLWQIYVHTGLDCVSIVACYFFHLMPVKRYLMELVATSLMFILM